MLLDALVSVIDTVQKRIKAHRHSLQQNETRTRMALIDPLLTALGWDVSDPSLVTPEYSVGDGRADYALMKESEKIPSAIVEAKRLGHSLNENERMQMLHYANARGVRYAAITDGNVWELYRVSFKGGETLEDRRLLNLKITDKPAHELALQLLLLWRPNLASGDPVAAQEPVLGTRPEPQATKTSHQSVDTSSAPPDSAPTGEVKWVKLSKYNPPSGTDAPKTIQFPDKTEKTIKTWKDLLVVSGEWLNAKGKLAPVPKPILSGPKEEVLDTDSSGFITASPIAGTEFVLNTHGSADNMRCKTRALLSRCGVSPDEVLLLLADQKTP